MAFLKISSILTLNRLQTVAACLLLIIIIFWWSVKLDVLPGLHGDEAWAGLNALKINSEGLKSLMGMNNYTGALQPLLAAVAFKLLGAGVYQLRIVGVLFNCISMLLIAYVCIKYKLIKNLYIFFLLMGQAALFIVSPRIAWEVNSLTLLFTVISFLSLFIIYNKRSNITFYALLFWIANILGSYNHVIFSSLGVALFMGLTIWMLYQDDQNFWKLTVVCGVNMINLVALFLITKYYAPLLTTHNLFEIFLLIATILLIEALLLNNITQIKIQYSVLPDWTIRVLMVLFAICFLYHHGIAFYDLLSNYKIYTHVYSWQGSIVITVLQSAWGAIILLYLAYSCYSAIINKSQYRVLAIILIVYCGILPLYTTSCSFRYYLILYVTAAIYLSLHNESNNVLSRVFKYGLLLNFCITNLILISIFQQDRALKAIEINIGNHQTETSAHFLPNKPLMDFLRDNEIDTITFFSDRYFLEQPIIFLKKLHPWTTHNGTNAIVDYDYSDNLHGGYLFQKK